MIQKPLNLDELAKSYISEVKEDAIQKDKVTKAFDQLTQLYYDVVGQGSEKFKEEKYFHGLYIRLGVYSDRKAQIDSELKLYDLCANEIVASLKKSGEPRLIDNLAMFHKNYFRPKPQIHNGFFDLIK